MMLHIDGSHHQWFGDDRWHDLIVILDDATSEIYHPALLDRESTAGVMTALWIDGPVAGKATGVPRLSHVQCLYLLVK